MPCLVPFLKYGFPPKKLSQSFFYSTGEVSMSMSSPWGGKLKVWRFLGETPLYLSYSTCLLHFQVIRLVKKAHAAHQDLFFFSSQSHCLFPELFSFPFLLSHPGPPPPPPTSKCQLIAQVDRYSVSGMCINIILHSTIPLYYICLYVLLVISIIINVDGGRLWQSPVLYGYLPRIPNPQG